MQLDPEISKIRRRYREQKKYLIQLVLMHTKLSICWISILYLHYTLFVIISCIGLFLFLMSSYFILRIILFATVLSQLSSVLRRDLTRQIVEELQNIFGLLLLQILYRHISLMSFQEGHPLFLFWYCCFSSILLCFSIYFKRKDSRCFVTC